MVLRTRLFESNLLLVYSVYLFCLSVLRRLGHTLLGALLMVCCFAVNVMMFVKLY